MATPKLRVRIRQWACLLTLTAVALTSAATAAGAVRASQKPATSPVSVTIGDLSPGTIDTLMYVTQGLGLFTQNNVNVSFAFATSPPTLLVGGLATILADRPADQIAIIHQGIPSI